MLYLKSNYFSNSQETSPLLYLYLLKNDNEINVCFCHCLSILIAKL